MKNKTDFYDIAVVGAGAAGSMAAIKAAQLGKRVILIERNDSLGRKIMLTGKGRCNITNTASIEVFIKKFNPGGEFLRTALFSFFNEDLMDFFRSNGLELKVERQGRVFPSTDNARSVVSVLEKCLKDNTVRILYNTRIAAIEIKGGSFTLIFKDGFSICSKKVIIATGGASYGATGSTGDGFVIARHMGHKIIPLKGALVPLKTKERWVKDLQGLALENVRISFNADGKKIVSDIGEIIFTHFGISGPLVLDLSGSLVPLIEENKEVAASIDLKVALTREGLEKKLIGKFVSEGNFKIKNLMQDMLPKRMVKTFLSVSCIMPEKTANQITRQERNTIINNLKAFPLTVSGSLTIDDAMVTAGGVSRKDINPRTMESRIIPGLYFAGEVIEGAAPSGGYNLQQAFSTGYLAGKCAAGK